MSSQLPKRLLPDLRVIRRGLEIQTLQHNAAHPGTGVVAGDAIGIQHLLMGLMGLLSFRPSLSHGSCL